MIGACKELWSQENSRSRKTRLHQDILSFNLPLGVHHRAHIKGEGESLQAYGPQRTGKWGRLLYRSVPHPAFSNKKDQELFFLRNKAQSIWGIPRWLSLPLVSYKETNAVNQPSRVLSPRG